MPNAQVHREKRRSAAQRNEGGFFRCNELLGPLLANDCYSLSNAIAIPIAIATTRTMIVHAAAICLPSVVIAPRSYGYYADYSVALRIKLTYSFLNVVRKTRAVNFTVRPACLTPLFFYFCDVLFPTKKTFFLLSCRNFYVNLFADGFEEAADINCFIHNVSICSLT